MKHRQQTTGWHLGRWLLAGLLVGGWACRTRAAVDEPKAKAPAVSASVPKAAAQSSVELPEAGTWTYGVYLNGHKVGWMAQTVSLGEAVTMSLTLEASVGGLGKVSQVALEESRVYRAKDGALLSLSFTQKAATGAAHVTGKVEADGKLHLEITAGNATQKQVAEVVETLADAMAPVRLAKAAKVGASATSVRFDPSVLKLVKIEHRVQSVEPRMFGGVSTATVQLESSYPELGIHESSWVDAAGHMLESKVGGFFVARLEPPDVAKRLDYHQDLLVSAVVQAPAGFAEAVGAARVSLLFYGFGDTLPPASPRQEVTVQGDRVLLTLRRDAAPSGPWPQKNRPAALASELLATPFIQSDDAELRAKAQEVAGDAKTLAEVNARLVAFVYGYIKDEYVPAYSNALEALHSGRGDCTEHSILYVAMARALGIPARVAVGIAYWPAGGGFGWHAWAEINDGARWITVDPTWNQPVADVTHVKLAGGGPAEQARIVMLLGNLHIESGQILAR